MKREYRFMTNKQKEAALELYKTGLTYNDIAGRLDIDPSRVGQLARKAGLERRGKNFLPLTPKQAAAAERERRVVERKATP